MRHASTTRLFPGERVCGDAISVWNEADILWFAIADGLGHGPDAQEAARAVMAVAGEATGDPADRLIAADRAIRSTRGAAAAIGSIAEGELKLAAAGNIHGLVRGLGESRLEGMPGIVGTHLRPPRMLAFPFPADGLALLWTDGLDDVTLDADDLTPPLRPARLVDRLMDRFARGTDDCGLLLVAGGS